MLRILVALMVLPVGVVAQPAKPYLTAEERALAQPISPLAPGDTCDVATFELDALPWLDTGTTVGLGDDIDLDADGRCAAGGETQFTGTGTGPDVVYRVLWPLSCDVAVNLDPGDDIDLALYIVTDCERPAASCVGVDDGGSPGFPERVEFAARGGTEYFIVVDGFDGDSGPYELTVTETTSDRCVPVELQSFTVE